MELEPKDRQFLARLGLLGLALWIGTPLLIYGFASGCDSDRTSTAGQVGDMFGSVNALFSGAALLGVVVALILQRRDLKIQQDQLNLSNKEFRQQNEMIQEQLRVLRESFEFTKLEARNNNDPRLEWE